MHLFNPKIFACILIQWYIEEEMLIVSIYHSSFIENTLFPWLTSFCNEKGKLYPNIQHPYKKISENLCRGKITTWKTSN